MLEEQPNLVEEIASSSDEALCGMLGLETLEDLAMNEESGEPRTLDNLLSLPDDEIRRVLDEQQSIRNYRDESVCTVPEALCLDPALMRRITDELSWGKHHSDKTFESIKVISRGELSERRKVTRFENFVHAHDEWTRVCDYIGRIASVICERPMTLFKEKLNLKPAGGSGFAPHLDTPSLRVALGEDGPVTFVTVMVAIDSMNEKNGCLQVVKGHWTEKNAVKAIQPESGANPDGNGRAGAIPREVADHLPFEPYVSVEWKKIQDYRPFSPSSRLADMLGWIDCAIQWMGTAPIIGKPVRIPSARCFLNLQSIGRGRMSHPILRTHGKAAYRLQKKGGSRSTTR